MDTKYVLRLGGAMVACALIGWFPFVAGTRVPLLGLFDFGIHELGHLLFIWAGRTVHFIAGSALQVAVPIGLTLAFLRWGNLPAAAITTAWTGANLWDVSVYVADAPYQRLVLWGGGQHDWATLLGQWGVIDAADEIAAVLSGLGGLLVVVAMALCALPAFFDGLRPRPETASAGPDGAL